MSSKQLELGINPPESTHQHALPLGWDSQSESDQNSKPMDFDRMFLRPIEVDLAPVADFLNLWQDALKAYQRQHNSQADTKHVTKINISSLGNTLMPLWVELGLYTTTDLPAYLANNREKSTKNDRAQIAGTLYHRIFEIVQSAANWLNPNVRRPLNKSIGSNQHHKIEYLEQAISATNLDNWSGENHSAPFFNLWKKFVEINYTNNVHQSEYLAFLENEHFQQLAFLFCDYLQNTYSGTESLIPESSPDFRKIHEKKVLLYDANNMLQLVAILDAIWLKQFVKKKGKQTKKYYDFGVSDIKTGAWMTQNSDTTRPEYMSKLQSMLLLGLVGQQYVYALDNNQVRTNKDWDHVILGNLRQLKDDRNRVRFLVLDPSEANLTPYQAEIAKENLLVAREVLKLINDTITTLGSTQVNNLITDYHQFKLL